MFIFTLIIPVFGISFYCYRRFWALKFFKRLGIPGPEPHWFWGNARELYARPQKAVIQDWVAKFGPTFGFFEGPTPYLITSSLDIVEEIFVSRFSNFQGRHILPVEPDRHNDQHRRIFKVSVSSAVGDHWKRLRGALNPAFSTFKLKSYMACLEKHVQRLNENFQTRSTIEQDFDIQPEFQRYTLDVVAEITLGIELAAYDKTGNRMEHPVLPGIRKFITSLTKPPSWMFYILPISEFVGPLVRFIKWFSDNFGSFDPFRTVEMIMNIVQGVIDARRLNPALCRPDILQSMMQSRVLTDHEIQIEGFALLAAGTETTSSLLSFAAYRLAHHPDIQQKLYEENEKTLFEKPSVMDYDALMTASYLDCVFRETLRLDLQSSTILNRWAVEDTTIQGVFIPKDLNVIANQPAIHMNADLWGPVSPQSFYPERFSKQYLEQYPRPDSAFLPFGIGPKMCIGVRLAQLEFKLVLAYLLHNYKFVEKQGGYPNGLPVAGDLGNLPADGVFVRLERR